jgi:hypothetical protein
MFWGFIGATRIPWRFKTRHSPAVSVLFPASEVQPWIMIVLAVIGSPAETRGSS